MIAYYLSNENLSLFENAAHIGLPVPDPLKNTLAQLHGRKDENKADTTDRGDGN